MKKLLVLIVASVAVSFNANAETVQPEFNLTGLWHSVNHGGRTSFFQEGTQVTFIYVNDIFAHYFIGRYVTPTKLKGIQHRVDRATGCSTEMLLVIDVRSFNANHVWARALDSQCDLIKGQTFTDNNTRVL
jgi:hypothetical protein